MSSSEDSKPSYSELETLCAQLQARVTRFSAVEQNLIVARDRIDRELARFQSIQSYSRKSLPIINLHDFGTITSESVVETFEFECSALYLYDSESNSLELLGSFGFTEIKSHYQVDQDFIDNVILPSERTATIEKPQPYLTFWEKPQLHQIIYCPFHNINSDFQGILLGGISDKNKDFYDVISQELISSFAVFSNQMESLLHNIESQHRIQHGMKMEAIGTLTGGIAHDFNNVLAAIMGYSEMAQIYLEPDHRARKSVDEIFKASQRAKKLIMQLLAFGRPEKTERKIIQIDPVVKEALDLLKASLPSTITIVSTFEPNLNTIEADPTQIHQLVMNICTNSAHSMEETGGTISVQLTNIMAGAEQTKSFVELDSNSPHVKLTIKDNGSGINPQIMGKIFDPYFTTKPQGKGTGIGLAQVHGIVKSHSGVISITSDPGLSTKVDVYFPSTTAKEAIQSALTEASTGGKGNILFVDDEKALVKLGEITLKNLGYSAVACSNPIEALSTFSRQPGKFDLVITDMTMPQMNGSVFAEKLKKIRPEIPIIICTGHSSLMDKEKAHQLGIESFIMKPVSMKNLAQAIQSVLHGSRKLIRDSGGNDITQ